MTSEAAIAERHATPRRLARRIAVIALPVIANNVLTTGMQFTDAIMAGRLSAHDLAAISVGGSVYFPFFLLALGVLVAVSPTAAQHFGAGRPREIGAMARQGIWLALVLAGALMLGCHFMLPVFRIAGLSRSLAPEAQAYVVAMSWGLPALFLYLVLRFVSEGIGHTRPILFVALVGSLLNIPLDYLFIFGGLGLPAMGAVGCGYASALVMWVELAFMLAYVLRVRHHYMPLALFQRLDPPALTPLRELVGLGLPIGVMLFAEVGLFGAVALLMASFGTVTAAAHQVAVTVATLSFMAPLGLATGIQVVVGQAVGAGRPHTARRAGRVGIAMTLGFELLAAVAIWLFRTPIAGIFTTNAQVLALASQLLVLAAAFQLPDGLQVASAGALRGLKDARIPMLITLVAYWGAGLPLAWWLGLRSGVGPVGVWAGLIAGLSVAGVLLAVRYRIRSGHLLRTIFA